MAKKDSDEPVKLADIKQRKLRDTLDSLGTQIAELKRVMKPLEDELKPLDKEREKLSKEFNAALVDSGIKKIDATVKEVNENGVEVERGWDCYYRRGVEKINRDKLISVLLGKMRLDVNQVQEVLKECTDDGKGGYVVRAKGVEE
jgi:Sec-independent protein translocase protein TatA